ncbi:hypothetical protein NDU88_005041 [Pleurodeles waltl]|uniref:Uncharacterized protein n=1 Tax=Pleurodeles waltl TaxID=8319 RepID=A0AAV7W8I1_PLEWA|nr:hypothetical protein NDU88_005041 [Pleurodeles waltl]
MRLPPVTIVAGETTNSDTRRCSWGTFRREESETSEHFQGHSGACKNRRGETDGVHGAEEERKRGEEGWQEEPGGPQKQEEKTNYDKQRGRDTEGEKQDERGDVKQQEDRKR